MERKEVTRMLVGVQPQGQGTIRVVGAKLHGIVVTESKLNYHGSITIDTDILEAARLLPLEYVYIWNKHSGSRIETYVLPGPRGSGVVCLNGAAARKVQVGDVIIIASYALMDFEDAKQFKPWIVFPDTATNRLVK